MRLVLLSPDFPPAPSGIGDYTDLLGHELAARGHDVVVLCAAPAETRSKIDVRPVITSMDARGIGALDAAVASAAPDAILWQYNPFQVGRKGIGPSAGRIARRLAARAPLVVVAHELWFPWGRQGARGVAWAIAQRLETASVIAAGRKIVVTTERRLATLRAWFPDRPGDIEMIPIGATVEPDATRAPNGARARYGLPPGAFVVAHLGSIGAGRNFGPLFDALRALRADGTDARLLCIGRTGMAEAPSDLDGAVLFTGVLARAEVSEALLSADAYAFCEPSGPSAGRKTSLLAAFAHGLPVVAFSGRDRDSGLRDGENVVLVAPRATAVAAALRVLAHDAKRRSMLGAGARRLYEERFAWPVAGDAFEEVLGGL
jgi:glycosyltransferase involved in cell wall biosynthesis